MIEHPKWLDISYPLILDNKWCHWLWKVLLCPLGIHQWDEISCSFVSPYTGKWEHRISCDACDLDIEIIVED